jgi:WD40 repeat protein
VRPASYCPDVEVLQRFVLGDVSDPEIAELERHLAQCPACVDALQTIHVEDTLIEAMRAQAEAKEGPDDAQVQTMIRKLEALRLPESAPSDDVTVTSAESIPPEGSSPQGKGEPTAEVYDFLAPAELPGELGRLGPYRIVGVLGIGGMGVVFRAEDPHLRRLVAVKVLLPGRAGSPAARERFLREAQAAAAVEHDHIIHINQVGEDRGVLFVAMPLLQGESLETRLNREGPLPLSEGLRIGREIAEGLAAAHERGLIHRDIKPANIWLEGARARVKILDFGLARPTSEDGRLTHSGVIVGTPAYMAPEQARGEVVDARADLFSLGCVLYRMAAGRPPFQGSSALHILSALALQEPEPLRQLNSAVTPRLEALVRQLLAKGAKDRPASAREVIAAIGSLERAPATGAAELAPASRLPRRRWLVGGLFILAGFLLAGVVFYVTTDQGTLQIKTSDNDVRVVVEQGGKEVQVIDKRTGHEVRLHAGEYRLRLGATRKDVEVAPDHISLKRGETVIATIRPVPAKARTHPLVKPTLPLVLRGAGVPVSGLAFSPDGRLLAAAGHWRIMVWDLGTGKEAVTLSGAGGPYLSVAFSPDRKHLAAGHEYSTVGVWDITTGEEILRKEVKALPGNVSSLAYSPDGKYLAVSDTAWGSYNRHGALGHLLIWDALTGATVATLADRTERIYGGLAYSPDGKYLATGTDLWDPAAKRVLSGDVRVWDIAGGKEVQTLKDHQAGVFGLAYSPDGKSLASAWEDGTVKVWDVPTGKARLTFREHSGRVRCLAFSPHGKRLVSGGNDTVVRICDAHTGKKLLALRGHTAGIVSVAFSPDGQMVASCGDDGTVRIWDASSTAAPKRNPPKETR